MVTNQSSAAPPKTAPVEGGVFIHPAIPLLAMNESVDGRDRIQFFQRRLDEHGFLSFLDMEVTDIGTETVTVTIPYHPKVTNAASNGGNVHGGIASTLVDTAGGLCVFSTLEDPRSADVATIDLNISYLRPARGDLVGTASVVRVGGTVGVIRVEVESETPDGTVDLVAVGRASYRIFRPESRSAEGA